MNYRELGNTGMKVSEIGLGCEHLENQNYEVIESVIDAALAGGINIMDVFMSQPQVRTDIGKALEGRREQVILQGHIGSRWKDGQYGRSRELEECKFFFEDFLTRMRTDYVDIGMFHCVDTKADSDKIFDNAPLINYALSLKKQGIIKSLGISTHDPVCGLRAVNSGIIDVIMFSINPAYDLLPENLENTRQLFDLETYRKNTLNGINPVREEFYRACETKGIGLTVMKSMGAGALLNAKSSPFGIALTPAQCIHYSLTRPAVSSVLVGVHNAQEIKEAIGYEEMTEEEKDYSAVLTAKPAFSLRGKCMYCNHCLPCPSHIDIAQVNKYLDLAKMNEDVPPTVKEHYTALEHTASECIGCHSCERNCPFGVAVTENMKQAVAVFGK